MELKDIKAIIDLMKKNSITEFELEEKDSKLRLKRGLNGGTPVVQYDDPAPVQLMPTSVPVPVTAPSTAAATGEVDIKSPMIGTFYRTPSPESAAYVEVGTEVNPETVVCIIEAMKVMNEIKAEQSGIVTAIIAKDGSPVQYGDVLFRLK